MAKMCPACEKRPITRKNGVTCGQAKCVKEYEPTAARLRQLKHRGKKREEREKVERSYQAIVPLPPIHQMTILEFNAEYGRNSREYQNSVLSTPVLNRRERYDEEEEKAAVWVKKMADITLPPGSPNVQDLLKSWNEADYKCLQAKIFHDSKGKTGIAAVVAHIMEHRDVQQVQHVDDNGAVLAVQHVDSRYTDAQVRGKYDTRGFRQVFHIIDKADDDLKHVDQDGKPVHVEHVHYVSFQRITKIGTTLCWREKRVNDVTHQPVEYSKRELCDRYIRRFPKGKHHRDCPKHPSNKVPIRLNHHFNEMDRLRKAVDSEARKLPEAHYEYFKCRVRQARIVREYEYDLDMGFPTADVTNLKMP